MLKSLLTIIERLAGANYMSKIELKLQASTKIVTAYLLKISEILLIEMGLIYVLDKVGMGG